MTENKGYYSGNSNIAQTLIDCAFDSISMVGKLASPFVSWLFDGWAKEKKLDFDDLFRTTKLCKGDMIPLLINEGKNDNYDYYTFYVPNGIVKSDFEKRIEQFSYFFHTEERNIRFVNNNYNVEVRILKPRDTYKYNPKEHKRKDLKIPMGYDFDGNLLLIDFLVSRNFGCYIAGSSGGGKSCSLRLLITHLMNNMTPDELELVVVNTKVVDLNCLKNSIYTVMYQKGTEGINELLKAQLIDMDDRYDTLGENDVDDIWEYKENGGKMPFRLLIIEEISAYEKDKDYQQNMQRIASMGRAAGIIPILVTQLPSREILPSPIKCNINTIIGHKTIDAVRSEVIAGLDSGLEKLSGDGHNKIFNCDMNGVEYQSLYVTKNIMKDVISKRNKEFKK